MDNEIACKNLEKLAAETGFSLSREGDGSTLLFHKGEGVPSGVEKTIPQLQTAAGRTVYFAASEMLGNGEEELGRILMEMFFFTLAQDCLLYTSL